MFSGAQTTGRDVRPQIQAPARVFGLGRSHERLEAPVGNGCCDSGAQSQLSKLPDSKPSCMIMSGLKTVISMESLPVCGSVSVAVAVIV